MSNDLRDDVAEVAARMKNKREMRRELQELAVRVPASEGAATAARANTVDGFVGLLVLTDSRLLFLCHGPFRKKFEDFKLDSIDDVSWSEGMLSGAMSIGTKGREVVYSSIDKRDGRALAEALRIRVAN